jgi:GT2 family glycosyltransferase
MPTVSALIPTWNRRPLVEALLGQLAAQTCPLTHVLVVDNGSTDGTADAGRALGAEVLALETNLGFAPAVNAGLARISSDYILIINNDVEIPPDWLQHLMAALESNPWAWFAAGRLLQPSSDTLDSTFDLLSRSGCAWKAAHGCAASALPDTPRRVRMVPFTAALFRRELFTRLGPLDTRFQSYLEDVDFGIRSALAGFEGLYVPQATGRHQGSATLGVWHPDTVRRLARNQVLLVAKHFPRNWPLAYGWPVLVGQLLWGIVAARHGGLRAYLQGKLEGMRLWPAVRLESTDSERFGEFVVQSEQQIRDLQSRIGSDRYWRVYFALT